MNCRAAVPGWNQLRNDMILKPVVFIAVNSGNSKASVEGYARETRFEWPLLVDESRATEKAWIGAEISLGNIIRTRILAPDGRILDGGFNVDSVRKALEGVLPSAKYLFDGIDVHPRLRAYADDIELGFYEGAVGAIASAAAKGSKDVASCAEALFAKIRPAADAALKRAKELEEGKGSRYAAYLAYGQVVTWFKGTEYEKPAAEVQGQLRKEKPVQEELAAQQLLSQARALRASGNKADQTAAAVVLAVLKKKHPSSEAAREVAALK